MMSWIRTTALLTCSAILAMGCRTTESETKDFDDVEFMRSGHQPGGKIVTCTDGRTQRITKVNQDQYEITENREIIATVSQAEINANICEPPGGGDPGGGNGGSDQTWETVLIPPVQAGGKFFLLPLYGLGQASKVEVLAEGTSLRVEDAFAFADSGSPISMTNIGNGEYYLENGQRRTHRFQSTDGRIQAIAMRAESNEIEGSLIVKITYRRPITYPVCEPGTRFETGGGCYNSSACFLPGGGCYNASACFMAGGGCYNASACFVAGGGCYNSSACYAPGGGCYNGSACWVPGGLCRNSSRCYDSNGRQVHPSAGKMVVPPGMFKYNRCEFPDPAAG